MNLQEKTRNFFQNYVFFGRNRMFPGTKYRVYDTPTSAKMRVNIYGEIPQHLCKRRY